MLGLQVPTAISSFYVGTGDPNSGPHACEAGDLSTEPSPHPLIFEVDFLINQRIATSGLDILISRASSVHASWTTGEVLDTGDWARGWDA